MIKRKYSFWYRVVQSSSLVKFDFYLLLHLSVTGLSYFCFLTESSGTYLGCFVDQGSRALPNHATSSGSMTPEYCINHCLSYDQTYAGVQSTNQCFCGDSTTEYDKYGQDSESGCYRTCAGDASLICGGSWAKFCLSYW